MAQSRETTSNSLSLDDRPHKQPHQPQHSSSFSGSEEEEENSPEGENEEEDAEEEEEKEEEKAEIYRPPSQIYRPQNGAGVGFGGWVSGRRAGAERERERGNADFMENPNEESDSSGGNYGSNMNSE